MDPGSYARSKRIIKKILLGLYVLMISVIFLTKILWTNQCRGGSGRFRILYSGNDLCTKYGIIYRNVHTFLEGGPTKNNHFIRKTRLFSGQSGVKTCPREQRKVKVSIFIFSNNRREIAWPVILQILKTYTYTYTYTG